MKSILSIFTIVLILSSCTEKPAPPKTPVNTEKSKAAPKAVDLSKPMEIPTKLESNLDKTLGYFRAMEKGDGSFFRLNINKAHTQNISGVEDGNVGYKKMVASLKGTGTKIDVYRAGALADFGAAHSVWTDSAGTYVQMDLFQFSEGKISEHWSARQKLAETDPADISYTGKRMNMKEKRQLVSGKNAWSYLSTVKTEGNIGRASDFVNLEEYTEHDQYSYDSKAPIQNYYADLKRKNMDITYNEVLKSVTLGDCIIAISKATVNGKETQIFDLFRYENSKIVEHWDVIAE